MVLLDARYLAEPVSGVQRYLLHLLRGTAAIGRRMRVLVPPGWDVPADVARSTSLDLVVTAGSPRDPREQWRWRRVIRQLNPSLVHTPDAFTPMLGTGGTARVVTIHDLIPLHGHAGSSVTLKRRLLPLWQAWVTAQASSADAVITVSHFSGRDLVKTLRVPPAKVRVIYNAVEPASAPAGPDASATEPRMGGRYVLCVGRFEPYKNTAGLVRAFARWVRDTPGRHETLVFVGPLDARFPEASAEAERLGIRERVHFTGSVSEAGLASWYAHAWAVVLPSLDEGFGLPALEAMSHGIPVLASDKASLPEVVGDAGLLVDVTDEDAFVSALGRVMTDETLRDHLRIAGPARSAMFTAERNALLHWSVYDHAGGAGFRA